MIRTVILIVVFAAGPVLAQETIVVEPSDPASDPVNEILDEIAPPDDLGLDEDSTLPERPLSSAGEASSAEGGVVRVLDKISGAITDLDLPAGETGEVGSLSVTLLDCRFPVSNPAGDAFVLLSIRNRDPEPVFLGWMIASAPAVSAMDHPRYDVWALRCSTS